MYPDIVIATNIQLLRSGIAHKRPDPSQLLDGQPAINMNADPASAGLYFRLTNGELAKVGPIAITYNGEAPNVTAAGHLDLSLGEKWLDANGGLYRPVEKVWYGTRWVTSSGFDVDSATGDFRLDRHLTTTTFEGTGRGPKSWIRVPQGDYDDRNQISPLAGMFRFNNYVGGPKFEGFDGTQWIDFATSEGDSILNNLELNGNLNVSGNIELGNNENDQISLNGNTVMRSNCTIAGDLGVGGDSRLEGPYNKIGNNSNSDVIELFGQTLIDGNATLNSRIVSIGQNTDSILTIKSASYLTEDVIVGIQGTAKLFTSWSQAKFYEDAEFEKDVIVGNSAFSTLTVNSTTRFRGPIYISAIPGGDAFPTPLFDVAGGAKFSGGVLLNDDVTLGSDSTKTLTVNSTAEFLNDLTVGTHENDTFMVNAAGIANRQFTFNHDVTIGDTLNDTLTVNSKAYFNEYVQFGSGPADAIHFEGTPHFFSTLLPEQNAQVDIGMEGMRFGKLYAHGGNITDTLQVHRLVVDTHLNLETDFTVGFDELHDMVVKSTSYFKAHSFFDKDVEIGTSYSDTLKVNSNAFIFANAQIGTTAANVLTVNSTAIHSSDIKPGESDIYNLGGAGNVWNKLWTKDIKATNDIECESLTVLSKQLDLNYLTVHNNVEFGESEVNTFDVNSRSTFNANVVMNEDVTIGSDSYDELFVNSVSNFKNSVTLGTDENSLLYVKSKTYHFADVFPDGDMMVSLGAINQKWLNLWSTDLHNVGDTFLGSDCTNILDVNASSTFRCKAIFLDGLDAGNGLDVDGSVTLGTSCAHTTTIQTLGVKCDTTLDGELLTRGRSDFRSSMEVSGPAILKSSLNVQSGAVLGSTLSVSSAAEFGSTVKIIGESETRDIMPIGPSNLGSPSRRWGNVYTQDFHLSNAEGSPNEVDGTRGDWTIQEGTDNLFIINNKTGEQFKIMMEKVS